MDDEDLAAVYEYLTHLPSHVSPATDPASVGVEMSAWGQLLTKSAHRVGPLSANNGLSARSPKPPHPR
jgi:hypothetical protein